MNIMCANTDKLRSRIRQVALSGLFGLVVSGCASNPSAQSDSINSQLSVQARSELERHLKEWEEVKPGIKRLIELEADLKFLISELSKANEIEQSAPEEAADNELADSPFDEEVEEDNLAENPFLQEDEPEEEQLLIADSTVAEVPAAPQQPTEVNEQPVNLFGQPITSVSSEPQVITNNVSQFQQPAETPFQQQAPVQTNNPLQTNSNTDFAVRSPIFNRNNQSDRNTLGGPNQCNDIGMKKREGSIALHLASFKQRANISSGWRTLLAKHNDVLCDRSAKSLSTQVNSNAYFSLRVGPYASRGEAIKDCQVLTSRGQYCAISQYDGDLIY